MAKSFADHTAYTHKHSIIPRLVVAWSGTTGTGVLKSIGPEWRYVVAL
jgi:hypothetical protein